MAFLTDEELLKEALQPSIVDRWVHAWRSWSRFAVHNPPSLPPPTSHLIFLSYGVSFFDPLPQQIMRFITTAIWQGAPRLMEQDRFSTTLQAYFGAHTFGSAFSRTGRIVNISVTTHYGGGAAEPHALVLNYLTAPQVRHAMAYGKLHTSRLLP